MRLDPLHAGPKVNLAGGPYLAHSRTAAKTALGDPRIGVRPHLEEIYIYKKTWEKGEFLLP